MISKKTTKKNNKNLTEQTKQTYMQVSQQFFHIASVSVKYYTNKIEYAYP